MTLTKIKNIPHCGIGWQLSSIEEEAEEEDR
jgi:hypothetical protein